MTSLPETLRETLRPLLPDRAFLRRDRGGALFITNAPGFVDMDELTDQLQMRGFVCSHDNGFLRISPGPRHLTDFELAHEPPDFFCQSLLRLRGASPSDDALSLFCRGIQLLESADPGSIAVYLRQTRQLAALSLRNRQGGAYACALIAHILETERSTPA